jgi:LysM repeat protein
MCRQAGLALIFVVIFGDVVCAQNPSSGNRAEDLQTMRQLLEQQTRQLEVLTREVARLTQLVDNGHSVAAMTPAAAQNVPPIQEINPPATPAETIAGEAPVTHTVSKGETLTSIAKQYKIPVGDLQKLNKIENDRKLQIGQTLLIPTVKSAESPQPEHP